DPDFALPSSIRCSGIDFCCNRTRQPTLSPSAAPPPMACSRRVLSPPPGSAAHFGYRPIRSASGLARHDDRHLGVSITLPCPLPRLVLAHRCAPVLSHPCTPISTRGYCPGGGEAGRRPWIPPRYCPGRHTRQEPSPGEPAPVRPLIPEEVSPPSFPLSSKPNEASRWPRHRPLSFCASTNPGRHQALWKPDRSRRADSRPVSRRGFRIVRGRDDICRVPVGCSVRPRRSAQTPALEQSVHTAVRAATGTFEANPRGSGLQSKDWSTRKEQSGRDTGETAPATARSTTTGPKAECRLVGAPRRGGEEGSFPPE